MQVSWGHMSKGEVYDALGRKPHLSTYDPSPDTTHRMERVAFLMDPIDSINPHTDTSLAIMRAAAKRNMEVIYVPRGGLALDHGVLHVRGRQVHIDPTPQRYADLGDPVYCPASDCRAIFIRSDPPFNTLYLTETWMLSFAEAAGVRIINSPAALRNANEKLFALEFPELCPSTLVTSDRESIKTFIEQQDGVAIGKPLHGFGGYGVVKLRHDDSNLNAIIDMLTLEGRDPIIVQQYLPEAQQGDKRLFMLNGQLRAALQRIPHQSDHRGNVHVGGSVMACEPDAHDQLIANRVGPVLRARGLFFVGMDVIAGKLIEINVTSPTLVQELKRLGGPDLANEIIGMI